MTREESIKSVCSIVALAYRSIGDYSRASDGFCEQCRNMLPASWQYENSGAAIDYVRKAVVEQLKRDGIDIAKGFDAETGIENPNQ